MTVVHQHLAVDPWMAIGCTFGAVRGKASTQSDGSCNDRMVRFSTRHRVDSYVADESSVCMASQDVVETPSIAFGANIGGLLATFGGREERVRDSHTHICSGADEVFAIVVQNVSSVRP